MSLLVTFESVRWNSVSLDMLLYEAVSGTAAVLEILLAGPAQFNLATRTLWGRRKNKKGDVAHFALVCWLLLDTLPCCWNLQFIQQKSNIHIECNGDVAGLGFLSAAVFAVLCLYTSTQEQHCRYITRHNGGQECSGSDRREWWKSTKCPSLFSNVTFLHSNTHILLWQTGVTGQHVLHQCQSQEPEHERVRLLWPRGLHLSTCP